MKGKMHLLFLSLLVVWMSACGGGTISTDNNSSKIIDSNDSNESDNNETNTTVPPIDENVTDDNVSEVILPDDKIFLIGDSKAAITNGTKVGWGTVFSEDMQHPENYFNRAVGGASSRSYKWTDGIDWDKTKQLILSTDISNGAFLLIELSTNDVTNNESDALDDTTRSTMPGRGNSYYTELKEYIEWSRANGVTPVLVTPLESLRKYSADVDIVSYYDRPFGNYSQTVRELAADENVLMLDLQQKSYDVFNAYEPEALLADFSGGMDEDLNIPDRIHFSRDGAKAVVSWIKELSCELEDKVLCTQFK